MIIADNIYKKVSLKIDAMLLWTVESEISSMQKKLIPLKINAFRSRKMSLGLLKVHLDLLSFYQKTRIS